MTLCPRNEPLVQQEERDIREQQHEGKHKELLQVAGLPDPGLATVRRASGLGPGPAAAKHVRLAEKPIEGCIPLVPDTLADAATSLRSLLRGRGA